MYASRVLSGLLTKLGTMKPRLKALGFLSGSKREVRFSNTATLPWAVFRHNQVPPSRAAVWSCPAEVKRDMLSSERSAGPTSDGELGVLPEVSGKRGPLEVFIAIGEQDEFVACVNVFVLQVTEKNTHDLKIHAITHEVYKKESELLSRARPSTCVSSLKNTSEERQENENIFTFTKKRTVHMRNSVIS